MKPKIALLHVGGSMGMIMNQKTGRISPVESVGEIHRLVPELQKEVSLSLFPISNIGSIDITPELWTEIANTIYREYDKYDGFVITHGTNTMSYTASALSFAIQGLSKPIILTGAILPVNDAAGDARRNLVYAIRAAQLDIAEVCVVLGPKVLRGSRTKKMHESVSRTFESTRFPHLADFTRNFEIHPWRITKRKRSLKFNPNFDPNVALITLYPGMSNKFLNAVLESEPHGILIRAFGPGMIPEIISPWLKDVTKRNIPIVMTSQVLDSFVDLQFYRKQLTLEKMGIISGKDMTYECALTKFMWGLAQTKSPSKLRGLIE
ncbi:asparaginase, partial [Candidatus Peribacteria bacterium]|nr:asparaginase [Candidatus Peribacteria bacterium]